MSVPLIVGTEMVKNELETPTA